jgi:hypothetical protein
MTSLLVAGCGSEQAGGPSEGEQLRAVSSALDQPIDRLRTAVGDARMSDRPSMVTLRATAERTGDALRSAQKDLLVITSTPQADQHPNARQMGGAVEDLQDLANALSSRAISIIDLELAAERAEQSSQDSVMALPSIDANALIASLRRSRRSKSAAKTRDGVSMPVGSDNAQGTPTSASVVYSSYTGPAFQAQLPSGGGWATPAQSQPTAGRLFRTSVRGPDGMFVIIDYTPYEAASFGGGYQSRTQVGQTAFGSATKYVFQGGRLPECQRSTCVDYIINDATGGGGFGVLAGGGSTASAEQIARTVAESLVPTGR